MAEMQRYLLIDETNTVINVFLWDGESPFDVEEGWHVMIQTDVYLQQPGARWINGEWVPPPPPDIIEVLPS